MVCCCKNLQHTLFFVIVKGQRHQAVIASVAQNAPSRHCETYAVSCGNPLSYWALATQRVARRSRSKNISKFKRYFGVKPQYDNNMDCHNLLRKSRNDTPSCAFKAHNNNKKPKSFGDSILWSKTLHKLTSKFRSKICSSFTNEFKNGENYNTFFPFCAEIRQNLSKKKKTEIENIVKW